jgi:tripartite-type tricarboxylate transporter receptor subunit TctC
MSDFKGICAVLALTLAATAALAQPYPSRPLRLIVPYPPGGSTDVLARAVAQKMGESMGQQIVVDNRGGAGGIVGSEIAARTAPDGYTFLLGTSSTHVGVRFTAKKLPYDPIKDFTPLSAAVDVPIAIAVHPSFPANTGQELVEYAKKNPGKLSYGSSGTGSAHHFAGEQLKQQTGIDMVHVPYKGAGPAMTDLIGNQIPIVFTTLSTALPYVPSGKVKVIGVVEGKRSPSAPNIPTIGETVPGYAMPTTWLGFFGPANLPAPIVKRLNAEIVKALHAPDSRAKLDAGGLSVTGTSSEEFMEMIRKDMDVIGKIVATAGIQPE